MVGLFAIRLVPFLFIWNLVSEQVAEAISLEEDLRLTEVEKSALARFRKRVVPILPHKYMKQDIYLIRWLRAKDNNVPAAEQMLKSNLRWRRSHKMDTINAENWDDLKADYPYTNDKHDKQGRPLGTAHIGNWNIRRAAVTGQLPRLERYLTKLIEEGCELVRKEQAGSKNVSQFTVIMNMEGFNQITHACPRCLPIYTNFVSAYEHRYPGFVDEIILINTPPVFDMVLNLVQPLFSKSTRRSLKIFGSEKATWMDYLDKTISKDQRRVEFGGTLKD